MADAGNPGIPERTAFPPSFPLSISPLARIFEPESIFLYRRANAESRKEPSLQPCLEKAGNSPAEILPTPAARRTIHAIGSRGVSVGEWRNACFGS
jgi:hypothetical protein